MTPYLFYLKIFSISVDRIVMNYYLGQEKSTKCVYILTKIKKSKICKCESYRHRKINSIIEQSSYTLKCNLYKLNAEKLKMAQI